MRAQFIVCTIVFGLLLPLTLDAQTIRLKNGNSFDGTVRHLDKDQVEVAIPGVGKMTFDKSEIVVIEESAEPASWQGIPQESLTPPGRPIGARRGSLETFRALRGPTAQPPPA